MNNELYMTVRALIDANEEKAKASLSQYITKTASSMIAAVDTRATANVPVRSPKLTEDVFEIVLDGKVLDTITRNDNGISNENDIKTMLVVDDGYDPNIVIRRVSVAK